ncbi:MAG: magnesium chelatase ATPase subunit [Pseudomonadota bacterium]
MSQHAPAIPTQASALADADRHAQVQADALAAATLFAIDPAGLGGVVLRGAHSADRDAWLAFVGALLPQGTPQRRLPLNVGDAALLGGLDFSATLQAGRPVMQRGLLAQADGGVVTLAMAERITAGQAARLTSVMDTGAVTIERDGLGQRLPARVGLIALDEGLDEDEQVPAALRERLALRVQADALRGLDDVPPDPRAVADARERLTQVQVDEAFAQALCAAALALGVDSMRAPLQALRVARAAAALDGRSAVDEDDVALAARLVLAHRATRMPQAQVEEDQQAAPQAPPPPEPPPDAPRDEHEDDQDDSASVQELAERVVEAAQSAIPPGLLALIAMGERARSGAPASGRAGALHKGVLRGRPVGARRGEPRGGARLNLLETLRAAAPWQGLRARQATGAAKARRIHVRREDFHVTRYKQNTSTTAIFVVDASGSSALHRLAEAKGAVELLLADCYVRRDRVAVIAFRGAGADLLLPPTRSLARAKRSLAGLPGGGGTPLAAALEAARSLAESVRRAGDTPVVVMLTDGRANIARDGSPGRERATQDALAAASALRACGASTLLLDTSPQPQAGAQALAQCMGAAYLPLPHADARAMSTAVRLATGRT